MNAPAPGVSPMLLVADASALVAEALRVRGRGLLKEPLLELVVAENGRRETEHELRRRVAIIAGQRAFSADESRVLLEEALDAVFLNVSTVDSSAYVNRSAEARQRMARDLDDAPTLALALALDCGIWTADRDFFGCGVSVWSTESLLWYVHNQMR